MAADTQEVSDSLDSEALKVISQILKSIHKRTGSQWRED